MKKTLDTILRLLMSVIAVIGTGCWGNNVDIKYSRASNCWSGYPSTTKSNRKCNKQLSDANLFLV